METRANYVLIGAFTLLGFLGLLGFFLWFARVELDRQFAYYDIEFPTVSGLSNASEVRFSGLPVGQVVFVGLSPDGNGQVQVRIEVAADTPVRTGTVATIESQGVTGVSYVGLSAGDPAEPLLRDTTSDPYPKIQSGRSMLQVLSQDAPEIIEEVLSVARQVGDLLGDENQGRISNILVNLERSSGDLGQALDDFSSVTGTVATASEEIAAFTSKLEAISAAAVTALDTANTTLNQVTSLAARAERTLDAGDAALVSGERALTSADLFIREQLPGVVADLGQTTEAIRRELDRIASDANVLMTEFRATGALASDRLTEAEATIAAADTMLAEMTDAMASVDKVALQLDQFIAGDGTALVADARALMSNANRVVASATVVAENDLPAIVADIRSATATAARVVEEVGADLSAAAGRVDTISDNASVALAAVTDTFTRANTTLEQLNAALDTGDKALAAADRAFTSADRVLNDDVAEITAGLRKTLGQLDEAMARVSADLPVITDQLRQTAESANSAFGQIEATVSEVTPPLRTFADDGLPQYTRLARETRTLIDNLDKLVKQIERDPARYFLGGDAPEFRR